MKQRGAEQDRTLSEARENLLKKIFAALLSHSDSHGVPKTQEMLEADRQTALFVQKVADNLNSTDFVAEVVAESRTEPNVDLEKVLNNHFRRQLQGGQPHGNIVNTRRPNKYAKNSPVSVLSSDEDMDMDEYCKARDAGPGGAILGDAPPLKQQANAPQEPLQPPRRFRRNYSTVWSYDSAVPPGFVPPLPEFAMTDLPVYVEMPQQKNSRSLVSLEISKFSLGMWRITRQNEDQASVDWNIIDAIEQRQGRNALLLTCSYSGAPGHIESYWMLRIPDYVTEHRNELLAHWPDSEFVKMKAVSNCPAR